MKTSHSDFHGEKGASFFKVKIGESSPVRGGALVAIPGRIGAFFTDLNL